MRPSRLLLAALTALLLAFTGERADAQVLVAGHGGQAAALAALQEDPATRAPEHAAPIAAGVTDASLAAAAELSERLAGRALLVLEGGEVRFERYARGWSAERPHPLASGTKSFCGVLAAVAIEDGLFASFDEPVHLHLAAWREDEDRRAVTVRQLLDQSSGLAPTHPALGRRGYGIRDLGPRNAAVRHLRGDEPPPPDRFAAAAREVPLIAEPGAEFAYGPAHFFAFGATLEAALAASDREERTLWDYLRARVLVPAGVEVELERFAPDAADKPGLPGGAHLTAREWARFGRWVQLEGARVGDEGEFVRAFEAGVFAPLFESSARNASYGLGWWLASEAGDAGRVGEGRVDADATPFEEEMTLGALRDADGRAIGVAMAAGAGKQRLYLIDGLDLVVVRFAEQGRDGRAFDDAEFLETLLGLR